MPQAKSNVSAAAMICPRGLFAMITSAGVLFPPARDPTKRREPILAGQTRSTRQTARKLTSVKLFLVKALRSWLRSCPDAFAEGPDRETAARSGPGFERSTAARRSHAWNKGGAIAPGPHSLVRRSNRAENVPGAAARRGIIQNFKLVCFLEG